MTQPDQAIRLIAWFERAVWRDMKALEGLGSKRSAEQGLRQSFRELFHALVGRSPSRDEVAAFERGED